MSNQTRQIKPSRLEQFKLEVGILSLCVLGALGTASILYESSTWNPEYSKRSASPAQLPLAHPGFYNSIEVEAPTNQPYQVEATQ